MNPKALVVEELFEDSEITHLTIVTVWYVGAIMGGYFGEDRSISYRSEKAHFGLFWAIAHTLLWCPPQVQQGRPTRGQADGAGPPRRSGGGPGQRGAKAHPDLASGGDGNEEAEYEDEGDF